MLEVKNSWQIKSVSVEPYHGPAAQVSHNAATRLDGADQVKGLDVTYRKFFLGGNFHWWGNLCPPLPVKMDLFQKVLIDGCFGL